MMKQSILLVTLFVLFIFTFLGQISGEAENEISPEEAIAVQKLRPMVEKYIKRDYMKTDLYLLKFLRSKQLNIEEAKEMFLTMLKWRRDQRIDGILNENIELERQLPYDLMSLDYESRPVGIVRAGQWDARRIVLAGKVDEAKRVVHKILEKVDQATRDISAVVKRNVTQGVAIVDLSGYSVRTHGCLQCIPIYLEIIIAFDSFYPRLPKYIIGVNTPKVFTTLYDVLRPALQPYTKETVSLFGFDRTEWTKYLLNIIPEDQLPKYLGGTRN